MTKCYCLYIKHFETFSLTFLRDDVQSNSESCIFDQLHNVSMRHVDNRLIVDGHDAVANLQLPAAVSWTALDDASDFVRHGWNDVCEISLTSFSKNVCKECM